MKLKTLLVVLNVVVLDILNVVVLDVLTVLDVLVVFAQFKFDVKYNDGFSVETAV